MVRYETLMLAVPEITAEQQSALEAGVEKAVKDVQGSILSFERWGKYRLAYPVRDFGYGVYYLVRFEVPESQKQAIDQALKALLAVKFNELIMRFITAGLAKNSSLAYQRPESLEEAPVREGYSRSRYASEQMNHGEMGTQEPISQEIA